MPAEAILERAPLRPRVGHFHKHIILRIEPSVHDQRKFAAYGTRSLHSPKHRLAADTAARSVQQLT
jgi:hypothetical protein